MEFKPSRALLALGVLVGAILLLAPPVQAEHDCKLNQNQGKVCPKHDEPEPEPEPSPTEGDRDGDGVPDAEDQCPNDPGVPNSPNGSGCPESEDVSSSGEELDLDLEEEEAPETSFECIIDEEGIELCLLQVSFYDGQWLWVVRAEDRCQDNDGGSTCQRTREQLRCTVGGQVCQVVEIRVYEEECTPNGACTGRLLMGDACAFTLADACLDTPIPSEADQSLPQLGDHTTGIETTEECGDEGSVRTCTREVHICGPAGCRRVSQRVEQHSCFTPPGGTESCRTYTFVRACDRSGECTTVTMTDTQTRCTSDGFCSESARTYDCVGGGGEDDLWCDEGELIISHGRSHITGPGGFERWIAFECDPATGRCRQTDTQHTEGEDGRFSDRTEVFDCSYEGVLAGGGVDCSLEYQQLRDCPTPAGPCTFSSRRNLSRDSDGRVTHYIDERGDDCAPDTVIVDDDCAEVRRTVWRCDASGRCMVTRMHWVNEEDFISSSTSEEVCVEVAPADYECRPVEGTSNSSRITESGEVTRFSAHYTCDLDTGLCDSGSSTITCNDDRSSCRQERRTSSGYCAGWVVTAGRCPEATEGTGGTREGYERSCDSGGTCTRTGSRSQHECETRTFEDPLSCPRLFFTSYSVTEHCPGGRADTAPERCTLLSSSSTTHFADGRVEEETVTCDPAVPSCQIHIRTTHPDGRVETRSWSCGPADADDIAPYRDGICLSLDEER